VFEAEHFEIGAASMSVMSWDRDHPEIPVVALWNAAPRPRRAGGSQPSLAALGADAAVSDS
jgi:hypothetical protein